MPDNRHHPVLDLSADERSVGMSLSVRSRPPSPGGVIASGVSAVAAHVCDRVLSAAVEAAAAQASGANQTLAAGGFADAMLLSRPLPLPLPPAQLEARIGQLEQSLSAITQLYQTLLPQQQQAGSRIHSRAGSKVRYSFQPDRGDG